MSTALAYVFDEENVMNSPSNIHLKDEKTGPYRLLLGKSIKRFFWFNRLESFIEMLGLS